MCKHREHAPVALLALRDVELHQDVAHVSLDGALARKEALPDCGAAEALGDEGEHVPLAFGELGERIFGAGRCDEARDDLRVERGSALGDSLRRERNVSTARTRSVRR